MNADIPYVFRSVRNLYETLVDPLIPPHTFGRLVDFGITDISTERSSANRDDIRAYDTAVLEEIAVLLA